MKKRMNNIMKMKINNKKNVINKMNLMMIFKVNCKLILRMIR